MTVYILPEKVLEIIEITENSSCYCSVTNCPPLSQCESGLSWEVVKEYYTEYYDEIKIDELVDHLGYWSITEGELAEILHEKLYCSCEEDRDTKIAEIIYYIKHKYPEQLD